jgi:hypothetical protein
MNTYYISATIMVDDEIKAETEEQAVKQFKDSHTYTHVSGMIISPEIDEIEDLGDDLSDD